MPKKPANIDEYLATASADQRPTLEKLRKTIRALAPHAEECITYGIAAFRVDGKPLVGFGASANHCSFYPMNSTTVKAFRDELADYDTSKGTIRFHAQKPMPVTLVRKLVRARLAELAGRSGKTDKLKSADRNRTVKTAPQNSRTDPAVAEFLAKLREPLKSAITEVRRIILGVSPEIHEGIKWNAPSFRTTEYFATLNLRSKDGTDRVWLILHLGAKAKDNSRSLNIPDPSGLLEWLARDRCLLIFRDRKDIQNKRAALEAIVRAWIQQV